MDKKKNLSKIKHDDLIKKLTFYGWLVIDAYNVFDDEGKNIYWYIHEYEDNIFSTVSKYISFDSSVNVKPNEFEKTIEYMNKYIPFSLDNISELIGLVPENLAKFEQYYMDCQPVNDLELKKITFDMYVFFAGCLKVEALKNNNNISLTLHSFPSDEPNKRWHVYEPHGFMGKYKGRDPHLFVLYRQAIEQKKAGTFTNLLSEKFKELAPYTHKKAPKE